MGTEETVILNRHLTAKVVFEDNKYSGYIVEADGVIAQAATMEGLKFNLMECYFVYSKASIKKLEMILKRINQKP